MEVTAKEAHLINESLTRGIGDYLSDTSFGIWSFWVHSERGRARAERIKRLLSPDTAPKFTTEPVNSLYVLSAILSSGGSSMKRKIAKRISFSGVFKDNLPDIIKNYSTMTCAEDQLIAALKEILRLYYKVDPATCLSARVILDFVNGEATLERVTSTLVTSTCSKNPLK